MKIKKCYIVGLKYPFNKFLRIFILLKIKNIPEKTRHKNNFEILQYNQTCCDKIFFFSY